VVELLIAALVVVANVLGASFTVPQILRLRRTQASDGVSSTWVGVGLAANGWWAIYAAVAALWGALPVSLVSMVAYGAMVALLYRIDGPASIRGVAVGVAVAGGIPLAALLAGGWEALAVTIGLGYAVMFLPAVLTSLRAADLGSLSATTWWMALAEAAIWFTYGLWATDVALLIGGAGGGLCAALVVAQLARRTTSITQFQEANSRRPGTDMMGFKNG
jgi:uncharacterized protein with PQ loop repeat